MKRGFTLVEMLIAICIFTIAILMTAGSLTVSVKIKDKVEKMHLIEDEAQTLAEFITNELESAEPGTVTVNTKRDILVIKRIDKISSKLITETFRPSINNRYLELVTERDGQESIQNLNSEKTRLKKFYITQVTNPGAAGFINIAFSLAEEISDTGVNNQVQVTKGLGQPVSIELTITAGPKRQ
jgi:prepilin-type N-terminal cleavage/methylation domain-containing protein